MKKTFFSLLVLIFGISSCGTDGIPHEDVVVEKLRRSMKNPDAFQLDSITYHPISLSQKLEKDISFNMEMLNIEKESLGFWEKELSEYKKYGWDHSNITLEVNERQIEVTKYEMKVSNNKEQLSKIKGTEEDTIAVHTYTAYYMAQNGFGAIQKGSAKIRMTNINDISIEEID